MYRPQFAYPLPVSPCEDQSCVYAFDATNIPSWVSGTLPVGASSGRIPLHLDDDADFYLRAIRTRSTGLMTLRLEDSGSNPLSDSGNQAEGSNYMLEAEYSDAGQGSADPLFINMVVLDAGADGVFTPAGGLLSLFLYNSSQHDLTLSVCYVELIGIKRYPGGCKK